MQKDFFIYNTKTKKKELFKAINEKMVTLYSCGPTVYSTPHIGNMRAYTFVDTLVRVLKYVKNYEVKNLINITDVGHLTSDEDYGDDKLDKAAKKLNTTAWEIAKKHEKEFIKSINKLNIIHPTKFPKATDHILEQIEMIKLLERKGYTYKTKDGIYYDTSKFDKYNEFANIQTNELKAGIRVDQGEKKNITDFALWKFSPSDKKRDMEWDSPWGVGFPGWHIECSAMAMKHLGNKIDIHTGGIDHISIHHTNEIAQTEALTKDDFVNYWMHVNFLQLKNEEQEEDNLKMSKSKGTAYTIFDLENMGYDGQTLKYFYLTAHYRNELKFNFKILDSVKNTVTKLKRTVKELKKENTDYIYEFSEYINGINASLLDDLDTPKMLSIVHQGLNDNKLTVNQKLSIIEEMDEKTGLNILNKEELPFYEKEIIELSKEVQKLLEKRMSARLTKNWLEADYLREKIEQAGYIVKDEKDPSGNLIQVIENK